MMAPALFLGVPKMYQMSQMFPKVPGGHVLPQIDPEGTGGFQSGLNITGWFWRCLDRSGGSGSSSKTGIGWLASPVGARLA